MTSSIQETSITKNDSYGVKSSNHNDDAIMPVKLHSAYRYTHASELRIAVNGFTLDMSKAIDKVYKFELKMYGIKGDGKEKELSRGPRNDVALSIRHQALWSIYHQMLKSHEYLFGKNLIKYFYDCGINFYSVDELWNREEGEKELKINIELLCPTSRDFLGKQTVRLVARLLPCGEVFMHNKTVTETDHNRSLLQFLEIATSQMMFDKGTHLCFRNKAYEYSSDQNAEIYSGKVVVSGMEKNIRLVGNSWDEATPIVQIDVKKTAFYKEQTLLDLISTLCNQSHPKMIMSEPALRTRVVRELKDITVRTTHLVKQRMFCIFGITTESASNLIISIDDQNITVANYILFKYQRRLQFPALPCVIERRIVNKKVQNDFHPIELLEVIRGQRVNRKNYSAELDDELIRNCRLVPASLKEQNKIQCLRANIHDENPYLRVLGIRVINKPCITNAVVHYPPAIVYSNTKVEPSSDGDLSWRLSVPRDSSSKIFLKPANAPRQWAVIVFQNAVYRRDIDRFIGAFINRSRIHGIRMPSPSRCREYDRTDMDFLVNEINCLRRNGTEYILFITKDKFDPVHDKMKLSEIKCHVVTQHLHSKTVLKCIGNRGAEMTLDNLVMKMNLKLGGITHGLTSSNAFLSKNQLGSNVMEQQWLRPTRMFFGIDMSHAGPQSLYERQAKIPPSEPTVVAMTYSCNSPFTMEGEYWLQKPRLAIVKQLEEHVEKALRMFKEKSITKRLPEHVFVFRGGISEGDYAKVISEEACQFKQAFINVANDKSERIRLTILVMQAHSNYRIYPENIRSGNACQQNVPPGTVAERDIVHPAYTEFLIVPHKSVIGTARPVRATVLVDDEPRLSMDELVGITNALCYAHGIVTSPISVPAHLYSASDLAKRGRNNFKTEQNLGLDDTSSTSSCSEAKGRFVNDGSDDYFPKLSTELANKLKYKFWA